MVTVVNKKWHKRTPNDFYIGRGSALGNPFSHMKGTKALHVVETREQAIDCYRKWLQEQIQNGHKEVIRSLRTILAMHQAGNVNLVCYCCPLGCHGDVIKEYIEKHETLFSKVAA